MWSSARGIVALGMNLSIEPNLKTSRKYLMEKDSCAFLISQKNIMMLIFSYNINTPAAQASNASAA